ncbi:MAG: hypothetical protein ACO1RA_04700 [Planctomycetaceae bacterium]
MATMIQSVWQEDDGLLSFEWVMLVTLLTIGVVAGATAARDGIIDELGDSAESMLAVDGSFRIDFPLQVSINPDGAGPGTVVGQASDSQFVDGERFTDCDRDILANSQNIAPIDDKVGNEF